jgi:restriction endonuclease S subunit
MSYLKIAEYYTNCFKKHGDNHLGVDWPNPDDTIKRYQVMMDLTKFHGSKNPLPTLLDFGCGAGHMLEYLQKTNQDLKIDDVLYTKDGKIGMCGMITKHDNVLIASGILRLRIKSDAFKKYGITPEYLFIALSTKETGYYPAIRRTVRASTIPHLREDKLKDIEVPLINKKAINKISDLVKKAFELKDKKKKLNKDIITKMDEYFENALK